MPSPLALLFILSLLPQGDTGQLTGIVVDANGAAIVGANVKLISKSNFLYGPGQKNLDISVVRFIPITETVRAEFRTEFFNLFNWTNFANPNNNIAVPATFGRITATSSGPRVIQFAFKVNL